MFLLVINRTVTQYALVYFGISIVGLLAVLATKFLSKKLGQYFYMIVIPCLGYMVTMTVFLAIGSVGAGRLPKGVGETLFLFGAETAFGAFQIIQTSLSTIFSQIIPPQFIVCINLYYLLFLSYICKQIRMMPLTSGTYALGKIVGPFFCELQVSIGGMGLIFVTLLILTAILMFIVIILSKHLRSLEVKTIAEPAEEENILNESSGGKEKVQVA